MTRTNLMAGTILASALATGAAAQTELSMWYHGAGNEVESEIINRIVGDFNESQDEWEVSLQSFPQGSYNDSVIAAALAGNLPDILDVDGPVMPNWAWSGYLQPLPIDESLIENFLPGTKGEWNGELYSIGLWDAAVAMVTRQSYLDQFDIRVPTLEEPWTLEEFDAALVKIKESGEFAYPLDLGMAWTGEWYPYAFSPFLQSFGGDIVDRETYSTAEGALNGDAAVEFGEWWQSLFERDLVPGTSQDPADRDNGFVEGKYAISWNGNWAALNILNEYGDDTLFLPAPDFGNGPVIGAASWQFGVSATSEHPEGAAAFIEFALQDEYLAAFSNGIGLIPPTESAAEMTENYKEGGPMAAFYELSESQAKLRPVTPGYVVAAKVFEKALADIANGADVQDTLDAAVDEIDADIERNQGYGH
ncbi:sugar ABC transporter substrate-binding protein [Limimaricola sp. G21655-S1]|uniref:sugar ABC transporter substrate-binding protein n=1 Tax=unclassified Limimaricola TaxID=2626459 RepID=UPI0022AEDD32|nr:sugar ABC transporter substrate-binding protein [Limimaricola sp. G21655-S1]MCZ4260657.1 sugar ABC transporter substrate-binding protein [Limimaricola sp. G21655-S1]